MTNFQNILVPVDFERSSQRALELAIDLALRFDARLTVFHAWDVPVYVYTDLVVPNDTWSPMAGAAQRQLEDTMAQVRKRLPRAESVLVRGPAAIEILSAAEGLKADLVVMGTHGRRGLNRAFVGSVAEKVVRASVVPVLTVRGDHGAPSPAAVSR